MAGLFARVPSRVSVYEVALRDGLQNERATVPLREKLRLADALVASGLARLELTSFVSPTWIPQLADADDFAPLAIARSREDAADAKREPPRFSGLVPNAKGLERAKRAGLREIAVFVSASETHNRKNVNRTIGESLEAFREFVPQAKADGLAVRAYVSTVWGCPYEGDVDVDRAADIAQKLFDLGVYQVSLGDTIGVGTPSQTAHILERMARVAPAPRFAMHMHDTRGTALANVLVGLQMGISDFDASVGGLGGCPYAPGAAGNVATEDLVNMLEGMGIETGIDLEKLVAAGRLAEGIVGRALPGKVQKAGVKSSVRR